jgi:hypothetical protein
MFLTGSNILGDVKLQKDWHLSQTEIFQHKEFVLTAIRDLRVDNARGWALQEITN